MLLLSPLVCAQLHILVDRFSFTFPFLSILLTEFLFVLGRTPKLAPEVYQHINSLLNDMKIDGSKMVKTNQDCNSQ